MYVVRHICDEVVESANMLSCGVRITLFDRYHRICSFLNVKNHKASGAT